MPRYFFHLVKQNGLRPDPWGCELPDHSAARMEAIQAAREIMSDAIRRGEAVDGRRFEVVDRLGRVVLVLPFRDAVAEEEDSERP